MHKSITVVGLAVAFTACSSGMSATALVDSTSATSPLISGTVAAAGVPSAGQKVWLLLEPSNEVSAAAAVGSVLWDKIVSTTTTDSRGRFNFPRSAAAAITSPGPHNLTTVTGSGSARVDYSFTQTSDSHDSSGRVSGNRTAEPRNQAIRLELPAQPGSSAGRIRLPTSPSVSGGKRRVISTMSEG